VVILLSKLFKDLRIILPHLNMLSFIILDVVLNLANLLCHLRIGSFMVDVASA